MTSKNKVSKKEKALFLVVIVYFFFSALLHFSRLTFAWEVSVGDYQVPTVISGLCVIFSIAVILLTIRILKGKKAIAGKEECDNKSNA